MNEWDREEKEGEIKKERERERDASKVSCIAPLEGIKIIADSIQTQQEPKSTDV